MKTTRSTIKLAPAIAIVALLAWGCDGGPGDGQLYPGQTDFTNFEPNRDDGRGQDHGGGLFGAESDNGAAPAPGAGKEAPNGRTGDVEEADIYRVDKDRLFYLNTYRGFIVYDVKNPEQPKRLSRLPVFGYPVEMFVSGDTVYALLRDVLYLTQKQGQLQFERHNVSQLVAIDISDVDNPKVLKRVDIIGQLREGVSRKIEDTIYVVSSIPQSYYWGWSYGAGKDEQKEQAWVYSFNVADPKQPQLVDKLQLFEGGSYYDKNDTSRVSRWFNGVAISATSNALMVVENWRTYGYVKGSNYHCGTSVSMQQAVVSIVDISDPQGVIKVHSKFETYGSLTDQFKQTYFYDQQTKKGTYVGIFARREWSSSNCQGSSLIRNTIESWDVTDGANPQRLDALAFGKPDETVRGSAFDRDRRVAYAITARQVDPLYAISFADPAQLEVLSEIDGLSGDMNVFRLIGGNQYLVGIGRDNSDTCQGFGDPSTNWRSTNVAVSIIDVRDLDKIRLVQRQCVAVKNAEWVGSALNWNLDQAHKMIGMHSDGKVNVITVPVYYYKKTEESGWGWWWYRRETAVGLMSWDLDAYDENKEPAAQQVLKNYGTIVHPKGEVRRSIVFTHEATGRRKVINLSDTHISLADIEDLSQPTMQSVVEIAPYQQQLFRFGKYIVEQVGSGNGYWYGGEGKTEFRVKALGPQLEDAEVLASFAVGQVQRVIKHGDQLVLFRYVEDEQQGGYYYGKTQALVYDLSLPTAPKLVSQVDLPGNVLPYYYYWCGSFAYWGRYAFGGWNNWVSIDGGVVFLAHSYDYKQGTSKRELVFLDLQQPSQPKVQQYPLTSSGSWDFLGIVADGTDPGAFYLNYRVSFGKTNVKGKQMYLLKYYAQRWHADSDGLSGSFAINLPGRLIRTFAGNGGTQLLTHDYSWEEKQTKDGYTTWQANFRLNLLQQIDVLGQPMAALLDSRLFTSFRLRDLAINGDKLVVNARRDWYYLQQHELSWYDQADYLMIYDISQGSLSEVYSAPTGTYRVDLMGVHQGRLFVNLPGDGVLVVDMDDPANPVGQKFLRTLGYATHIEFGDSRAYIAAGYFGIYELDLAAPIQIPML